MKKLIIGFLVTTLIAAYITPLTTYAVENGLSALNYDQSFEAEASEFLVQAENKTGFNVEQIDPESVVNTARELGINTAGNEIILSDEQLVTLLRSQGADIQDPSGRLRAHGVTKIIKVANGSWNIYLNASFIRDYYWYAAGAAAILGCLAPGIGWSLAFTVMGLVAAYVERNTKHGCVVAIRNWRLYSIWRQ